MLADPVLDESIELFNLSDDLVGIGARGRS
jgi:hypothetical protein